MQNTWSQTDITERKNRLTAIVSLQHPLIVTDRSHRLGLE